AEDGIRDFHVTGVQTCALPIFYREARVPLGGTLHKDPASGWELPGGRRVFCVTTDKPERLQGLSGENLLCCVDEGSGYPDELWAPIFGNMQSGEIGRAHV